MPYKNLKTSDWKFDKDLFNNQYWRNTKKRFTVFFLHENRYLLDIDI